MPCCPGPPRPAAPPSLPTLHPWATLPALAEDLEQGRHPAGVAQLRRHVAAALAVAADARLACHLASLGEHRSQLLAQLAGTPCLLPDLVFSGWLASFGACLDEVRGGLQVWLRAGAVGCSAAPRAFPPLGSRPPHFGHIGRSSRANLIPPPPCPSAAGAGPRAGLAACAAPRLAGWLADRLAAHTHPGVMGRTARSLAPAWPGRC